jgi:hypothetical protein
MESEVAAAIIGAVATVAAALLGIWFGRRPPKENPKVSSSVEAMRRPHRFDVFVSSPLAGFATDAEIEADHDRILPIVEFLEKDLGYRVCWAGRNIRSRAEFDQGALSARDDVRAILDSKCFLLLYPSPIVSSVLFEAGIALRSCLISIYLVRSRDDLPFLMRHAAEAFDNVRTCVARVPDEALALFRRHGRALFEHPQADLAGRA